MIIRNAVEAGQELANEFVAVDELENCLGRCRVEPVMNDHIMPERPLDIKISAEGRKEAELQLLAAAMARAMVVAKRENPGVKARIYAECRPDNDMLMAQLGMLGFDDSDAIVRMRRRVLSGPNTMPLPAGCAYVADRLTDAVERRYFLDRAGQLFKIPDPEKWLTEASAKPCFRRLLLTARSGLAGELICWAEPDCGVIGHIYTTPAWRRKGVAAYLMEAARLHFYQCRLPESIVDLRLRLTAVSRLAATSGYRRSETLVRLPGIDLDAD